MTPDLRAVIKVVYRPEICDQAWLQALSDALQQVFGGSHGVLMFMVDWRAESKPAVGSGLPTLRHVASSHMVPELREALLDVLKADGFGWLRRGEQAFAGTLRAASDAPGACTLLACKLHRFAIHDAWALASEPFHARTLGVLMPLCGEGPPPALLKAAVRLTDHLASGLRLRAGPIDDRRHPAGQSPLDQWLPLASVAPDPAARLLRRDALAGHSIAALRAGWDACAAARVWSALLRGTWTLIDRFDTGGHRYLVACKAETRAHAVLSSSQYHSLAMRSAGYSLKAIASELGLAVSTVATAVSKGRRRLGFTESATRTCER